MVIISKFFFYYHNCPYFKNSIKLNFTPQVVTFHSSATAAIFATFICFAISPGDQWSLVSDSCNGSFFYQQNGISALFLGLCDLLAFSSTGSYDYIRFKFNCFCQISTTGTSDRCLLSLYSHACFACHPSACAYWI